VVTLSVWPFDAPQGAEQALPRLERLAHDGDISVEDAALVSWPAGHRKPSTRELGTITGPGRLWGGFWGIVLGLIFLTPLAGPAFGAAAGAVAGSLSDFGVEDDFIKRVRDTVSPGTSAVFVVSTTTEQLAIAFDELAGKPIRSDLTHTQAQNLHDVLGAEVAP
jgi:uncharacterized membrane protein